MPGIQMALMKQYEKPDQGMKRARSIALIHGVSE